MTICLILLHFSGTGFYVNASRIDEIEPSPDGTTIHMDGHWYAHANENMDEVAKAIKSCEKKK